MFLQKTTRFPVQNLRIFTLFKNISVFFSTIPTTKAEQKNMPGHVLRELHRFLERNKKHAEQTNRKKTQNKKTRGAKKNTLT